LAKPVYENILNPRAGPEFAIADRRLSDPDLIVCPGKTATGMPAAGCALVVFGGEHGSNAGIVDKADHAGIGIIAGDIIAAGCYTNKCRAGSAQEARAWP
jgi:hypothetical protein